MKISKNDDLILSALKKSKKPLSAYEVLSKLSKQIKSPPIVYRSLKRLEDEGKIHQIQSTSTYTVCHGEHEHQDLSALVVCTDCGKVTEVEDKTLAAMMKTIIEKSALSIKPKSIEIIGSCSDCIKVN